MQTIKEKIIEQLKKNDIAYECVVHEPAATAQEYQAILKTRFTQQAKAILVRYKREGEKGYAIIAIQAQKKLDMEKAAKALEAKKVRMANKDEMWKELHCKFGEVPAFGSIFGLQLFLDKDFLEEEKIYSGAGGIDVSVIVSPKDLARIEGAKWY